MPTAMASTGTITPMANEAGIDTITTSDARKPSGRSVSRTSAIAIMKSRPSVESAFATSAIERASCRTEATSVSPRRLCSLTADAPARAAASTSATTSR